MFNKIFSWCQKVLPLVYDDSLSYYEAICKLVHKVNELVEYINTLPAKIKGIITEEVTKLRNEFRHSDAGSPWITTTYRYYVDGTNGDDNNDGRTTETAFKTLDRWLAECRSTKLDIRCYITTAGKYDMHVMSLTALPMHITGLETGIIVNIVPPTSADPAFYQCHPNFNNITIKCESERFYFDGGSCFFDSCVFNSFVQFYGNAPRFKKTTFNGRLQLNSASAELTNCIFNDHKTDEIVNAVSSTIFIRGNSTVIQSPEYDRAYPFMRMSSSTCYLDTLIKSGERKYSQTFLCDGVSAVKGTGSNIRAALNCGQKHTINNLDASFRANVCDNLNLIAVDTNTYIDEMPLLDKPANYGIIGVEYSVNNTTKYAFFKGNNTSMIITEVFVQSQVCYEASIRMNVGENSITIGWNTNSLVSDVNNYTPKTDNTSNSRYIRINNIFVAN